MRVLSKYVTNFLRMWSSGGNAAQNAEQLIHNALRHKFPEANVEVQDVSGGCGAMFEVYVAAKEFKGLTILKQHKLITETLKEQIKDMHGVRIHTEVLKE